MRRLGGRCIKARWERRIEERGRKCIGREMYRSGLCPSTHEDLLKMRERYKEMYYSGMTVKQIAQVYNVETLTMYQRLKKAGCVFRSTGHPKGYKPKPESIEKSAQKRRGLKLSAETKQKMSEAKKCHYNGLNGYGHTKKHNRGYILAYAPDHPNATKDGYIMLHTVIMEQHLHRYLNPREVVHHINHIRDDNRIENLALMDKKEHAAQHMKERHAKRRNGLSIVANSSEI